MNTQNQTRTLENDGTITTTTPEDTSITNAQHETILAALASLHPIVANRGVGGVLPPFDKCGDEEYSWIFNRAKRAMTDHGTALRAARVAAVKDSVAKVIATHRATLSDGRKAVQALLAAEPSFAATVLVPSRVDIPLFALLPAFAKGTSETDAILMLRDLGYEVLDGQGKGKDRGPKYIRLEWSEPSATDAAPVPVAKVG
jgi:hypothetical protein